MKKKTAKKYIYEGLGFFIELIEVEMLYMNGEWSPMIVVRKVPNMVIKLLPFQNERLTGSQIAFVRSYFGMSLRKFATEVVKESHMAVSKWEKFASSRLAVGASSNFKSDVSDMAHPQGLRLIKCDGDFLN